MGTFCLIALVCLRSLLVRRVAQVLSPLVMFLFVELICPVSKEIFLPLFGLHNLSEAQLFALQLLWLH